MNAILLRRLLATAIILLSVSGARAQLYGIGYSISGGSTLPEARLKNADGFSVANKEGFRVGPTVEYMFKSGVAFDASLYFARYDIRLNDGNNSYNFGRSFIELPLNIKFSRYLIKAQNFALAPMIVTGPSFMFNIGRHHAGEYATQCRFQPAWNVGGGFELMGFLQVTVGYRFGLNNFIKRFDMRPDAEMRCKGIYVTAGFIFRPIVLKL